MPWPISYLLPAEKWLPPYWPPYDWQIITFEHGLNPPIPEGAIVPWWLQPKDQWPYDKVPWAQKTFGAFTARKVMMWPEDLQNYPPFGNVKVNTPKYPKLGSHQLSSVKVHMRPKPWLNITPHPSLWKEGQFEETIRQMSRKRPIRFQTDSGTITLKSIRSAPWNQYQKDHKIYKEAIKAKREEAHMAQLAEEIVRTKGEPQPTKDLFE